MNIEEVRTYCLGKRGVTEDMAFGPNTLLFRLCHKIFACLDLNRPNLVVVKMDADEAVTLRDRYRGIQGAWHWNKKYWSDVYLDQDVDEQLVKELLDQSFELIRRNLPQKTLFNIPELPEHWEHWHFPVLDSAMNVLRSDVAKQSNADFLLVTADFQTAGRGQGTNTWESEDKKNLLLAFRFFPKEVLAVHQFRLLQCISIAVAMTLEKFVHHAVKIKWPNDIYCDDRKICGILIEHDLCGPHLQETRCGIGININQQRFVGNAPNPISLFQLLGKEVDRGSVLRHLIKNFQHFYESLLQDKEEQILDKYNKRLYRLRGWYPYRDARGEFEAHLCRVLENGCLVLMDRQGIERTYAHKEVEYLLSKKEYIPSTQETKEWNLLKKNE